MLLGLVQQGFGPKQGHGTFIGRSLCRLAVLGLCVSGIWLATSFGVRADEASYVFRQLMLDPDNPELNFRYGALCEANGEPRKALQAYARVVASDPSNEEAKHKYNRLKRQLQPAITSVRAEVGASYMSNPRQLTGGENGDDSSVFDVRLNFFSDRPAEGVRWQTFATANFDVYGDTEELTNGSISGYTGPVFDISDNLRLHVAPGGSFAWLDDSALYSQAALNLTFSSIQYGTRQSVTFSGAYRDVNSDFSSNDGFSVGVTGRFAASGFLTKGDGVYVVPSVRYSEPSGDGPGRVFSRPLFPGDFLEVGSRFYYFLPNVMSDVHVGFGMGIYWRDYEQTVAFNADKERRDTFIEPTAHVILADPFKGDFDLRFDYRYEENFSNDDTEDFQNHVFGTRVIRRY